MAEPATLDEYNKLYHSRTRYEGFGVQTTMVMPCPFCCAADHVKVLVLDSEEIFQKGATCTECKRSWRAILQRSGNGVGFEIVQTGGDGPPAYLPAMRRVESGTG